MELPSVSNVQETRAKTSALRKFLALSGLVIFSLWGWWVFLDRETRSAYSESVVPMFGDAVAISFRNQSERCGQADQVGLRSESGRLGSLFPFASQLSSVDMFNAQKIASQIGLFNKMRHCFHHAGRTNLPVVNLVGFAGQSSLISRLQVEISAEPSLKQLQIEASTGSFEALPSSGEALVILTCYREPIGLSLCDDRNGLQQAALGNFLHRRLQANSNLTVERLKLSKKGAGLGQDLNQFGFSLWFGSEDGVQSNVCQLQKRN